MKLTILTQYFPPEIGAPQNRLFELALRLQKEGVTINVITAMPNYPHMKIHEEYKGKWFATENMSNMHVNRSWIYVSTSKGIFKRLLNYFSFVFTSLFVGLFKSPKTDVLLVESPPLFLGISAYLIAKIRGQKLIFNVSDLWPESAEKLGLVTNKSMLKMATVLEEFMYRNSNLITGQTQGIVENIKTRFPQKAVYWLPNGVDMSLFAPDEVNSNVRQELGFKESDILFFYGGIIGHAQGLEVILKAAALIEHSNIQIVVLGEGPEKEKLLELKEQLGVTQVHFYGAVPKAKMPQFVKAMDVAIIPLRKLDLFKGAIPSKIFENLAMKNPILLGVEGEAKELFIDQGNTGLFFEPENEVELAEAMNKIAQNPDLVIEFGENARNYVSKKFDRNILAKAFYKELEKVYKS